MVAKAFIPYEAKRAATAALLLCDSVALFYSIGLNALAGLLQIGQM